MTAEERKMAEAILQKHFDNHDLSIWDAALASMEAYAAQQSKMPTGTEIQEAANNYNRNAPIVDQSRMGFKAGVEWLRNQIER